MNDSTVANDSCALQSGLFKDQMFTDMQNIKNNQKNNITSSEAVGAVFTQCKLKPLDEESKEFSFEKNTISKKSKHIKSLGDFYENQKNKTTLVMMKLQLEAQHKLPIFQISTAWWGRLAERIALASTILSSASFMIMFIMMIYYLCGVNQGSIA